MEKSEAGFSEWVQTVPAAITEDPLRSVEAYRLGLYVADTAWPHVLRLNGNQGTRNLGNQLYRSAGSIPANVPEGYSRSSTRERARFYEFALGSSRETRDWYFLGRHVLGNQRAQERMELVTQIIKLLTRMVRQQRYGDIREDDLAYRAEKDYPHTREATYDGSITAQGSASLHTAPTGTVSAREITRHKSHVTQLEKNLRLLRLQKRQ